VRATRLVPVILLAAIAPAAAIAQGPDTLTPDGPATLYSDWHGAQTDEGLSPAVLTRSRSPSRRVDAPESCACACTTAKAPCARPRR